MKILIDNGHGVDTAGKRSPDGSLREYKYTREIAEKVVSELKKRGFDAERIVTEENDISLSERCRRVNSICDRIGTKNVILVSIHCNAAGNGSQWMNARGWEAWTSVGQTAADKMADCLYKAAEETVSSVRSGKRNDCLSSCQRYYQLLKDNLKNETSSLALTIDIHYRRLCFKPPPF